MFYAIPSPAFSDPMYARIRPAQSTAQEAVEARAAAARAMGGLPDQERNVRRQHGQVGPGLQVAPGAWPS